MENKRILVIGGFGYIGREIVTRLIAEKYEVTVLSRNSRKNAQVNPIRFIKGSVLDKKFLASKVKGFDIVIYLAAIVQSVNKSRYRENARGVENIVDAMHLNKTKKIIYFSTQNVHISKTGPYGNSKKQCERIILNSDLDYMVIRPNYVYGIDKQNNFYKLRNIIRKIRICPIIGKGNNKIQPINKKDIGDMTVDFVKEFSSGSIIDISGKTAISVSDVADYIEEQGGEGFIRVHVPIRLLKLFKNIIPFDVDGFAIDRISPLEDNSYKISSNIWDDLDDIFRLK